MAYLIGGVLALATLLLTRLAGLDRDRALYPVMLIVVASYYELFAAMGGPTTALWTEASVFSCFVALAYLGLVRWPWLFVVGLAGHGIFDAVHAHLIVNAGVPIWWPAFCGSFDVIAAAGVAVRLATSRPALEAPVAAGLQTPLSS